MINMSISADQKIAMKEFEKLSKYKDKKWKLTEHCN